MKGHKILRDHFNTVIYSENHLKLLQQKRERSKKLLEMFAKEGLNPFIYGSIARGDVHNDSDIDIVLIPPIAPYQIEIILDKNGFNNYFREIIMATPADTLKLYIYLNELESITIPLSKFDKKSREFYDFGGKINLNQIKNSIRVPGIDKRLVLIQPNSDGHEEYSIIGNENLVAKQLNVSIDLINERKKVLLKREKFGKTGVFLKRSIEMYETTEDVLKKLANKKSIVRKKLLQR
ncbi:MAG: nucleotidyltransferase domain-containing protein [Candidatus Lokiarchaeota archaeon]|nr:nucleotidyltransferase domain-containing protein [Candidatus Lokiarchaeota archaeon]